MTAVRKDEILTYHLVPTTQSFQLVDGISRLIKSISRLINRIEPRIEGIILRINAYGPGRGPRSAAEWGGGRGGRRRTQGPGPAPSHALAESCHKLTKECV